MKKKSFKESIQRAWFFGCGLAVGLTTLSISFGSVPSRVTDDTALYQKLSEIRVAREAAPSFDSDVRRLSQVESRYAEKLPPLGGSKLNAPMRRISEQQYQYTGNRKNTAVRR